MKKRNSYNPEWLITTSRYVCFIDIMGFKDLVARQSHAKVFNLMSRLSDAKELLHSVLNNDSKSKSKNLLYTTTFSDSIIIFSKDNSDDSEIAMMISMSYLFEKAMSNGIPLKGALSFGRMSVDKEKQIFFGQPLIDAYLLQEDLFYYGIVIHNSAEQKLTRLSDESYFKDLLTPLKSGNIYHYNLNWFAYLTEEDKSNKVLEKAFKKVTKKHRGLTSGRPRKYLDNTLQVFNSFYQE